MNPTQD